jgi:multidrug efflux pump subunit AcrB
MASDRRLRNRSRFVIIGGLISATLLTLFVLPVVYLILDRSDSLRMPEYD